MNRKTFPPSVFFLARQKNIQLYISAGRSNNAYSCGCRYISGKAILLTIIYHLLNLDPCDFCGHDVSRLERHRSYTSGSSIQGSSIRASTNKFFMNKVPQVTTRVYKNAIQASEALQPYFKESEGIQASVAAFLQNLPSKNFFPTSRLKQERRKI
jgi:hypothetical protein